MKLNFMSTLVVLGMAIPALANDTGFSGITVKDIRMREYKYGNNGEEEVQRILKPFYKITFKGGEASQLQKILPSLEQAGMGPENPLHEQFAKSFKTLAIFSPKTDVTSKLVSISCESATMDYDGNGNASIKPKETECTIQINHLENQDEIDDSTGNMTPFAPRCEQ